MLLRNCLPKCELAGKWTRPDVRGRVVLNQKRSKIQMFSRSKYCSDSLWPLTVVVAAEQGTGGTGDRWKTREGARRGSRKSDAHPPRAWATSSWRKVCKWLCSHSAFVFVQPASDARISAPETRRQLGAPLSLSLYAYNFNVYLLFHQLLGKMRRFRFFLFFVVVLFAGYNQRPEMERIHLIKEEYSQHGASGYTMEMT